MSQCKSADALSVVQKTIEDLDLDPIKFKLMDKEGEGWSPEQVKSVERWYRRFLFLAFKYPNVPLVVTRPIDTFWHHHIMDTRKYAADCQSVFGYFLHHFPYFGMRGEADARNLQEAFEATLRVIEGEYGESLLDARISDRMAGKPVRGDEPAFAGVGCSDCSTVTFIEEQAATRGLDLTRPKLR